MCYKTLCLISTILLIFSCSTNPINNDKEDNSNTIFYESDEGIISRLEIEKSFYSLNDTIMVNLLTVNESDTHKIHIHTNHGPLWHYYIYNENMDQVERLPRYFTNTVYNFYFSPGDSFKSHLNWLQSSFSNNIYTDLKVFSGKYYITASQPGLSSNKIGKWIEIEENGEPLSSKLYWYFGDQDSVKLGFLIRNRISKKLEYQLKMNEAIKIKFFRNESDTLSNEINVSPDFNNIILEAKSDNKVFTFRESKNKLIDKGISGSYYCMIEINCVSTIISARALVIIN